MMIGNVDTLADVNAKNLAFGVLSIELNISA